MILLAEDSTSIGLYRENLQLLKGQFRHVLDVLLLSQREVTYARVVVHLTTLESAVRSVGVAD